jgi:hypothetical protein
MNTRSILIGTLVAAGVVALYTTLPVETKEKVMTYVRGFTDQLPDNIKRILPAFLLSGTGVVEKGLSEVEETLLRV